MKYIFRKFETQDGEHRYQHYGIHQLGNDTDPEEFLHDQIKDFWGKGQKKEDGWYEFKGTHVLSRVHHWYYIDEDDYDVLAKYL